MSPFIVTTNRWLPSAEDHSGVEYIERRAVATLDEPHTGAVDEVARIMLRCGVQQQGQEWARIVLRLKAGDLSPVGPLPDGTVIEVTPWAEGPMRAWAFMYGRLPADTGERAIIDAFNARHVTA